VHKIFSVEGRDGLFQAQSNRLLQTVKQQLVMRFLKIGRCTLCATKKNICNKHLIVDQSLAALVSKPAFEQ
jgi:hypothetical protein